MIRFSVRKDDGCNMTKGSLGISWRQEAGYGRWYTAGQKQHFGMDINSCITHSLATSLSIFLLYL